MNILAKKTKEIEETAKKKGTELLSRPGKMKSNKSRILANKSEEKIVVLILNKAETKVNIIHCSR